MPRCTHYLWEEKKMSLQTKVIGIGAAGNKAAIQLSKIFLKSIKNLVLNLAMLKELVKKENLQSL